jgi:hypothetical protein
MDLRIRPVCDHDIEDLVHLSLLAWIPIFDSFESMFA